MSIYQSVKYTKTSKIRINVGQNRLSESDLFMNYFKTVYEQICLRKRHISGDVSLSHAKHVFEREKLKTILGC